MTRSYYFAGHESLSNRGCEALLRGITSLMRSEQTDARFYVPSFGVEDDRRRWPEAEAAGVQFVPAYRLPRYARLWARAHGRWPAVRRVWLPQPGLPERQAVLVTGATDCIMTGGDVLSLDYGVPSLIRYLGQARQFIAEGKAVHLWAASVGPFNRALDLERHVVASLSRYASLTVRESATLEYLHGLGLRHAAQVADPAFVMAPQPWDVSGCLPTEAPEGVLGFNISPLIHKLLQTTEAGATPMEEAVIAFWRHVLTHTGLGIVLVPHVDSHDGGASNSDYVYMARLLERAELPAERIRLAPRNMNAAEVKYLIAQCRYFIGARTHATIAAWSTRVPTLSLGYSVKARGLNRDLFDDERFVLDTKQMSLDALVSGLDRLQSEESSTRALLAERIPLWKERAAQAARTVVNG